MFEARGTQDGDPLADVFADLPPDEDGSGYDPEFEELLSVLLSGHDDPTPAEVEAALADVKTVLAREYEYAEVVGRLLGERGEGDEGDEDIVEALLGRKTKSTGGEPGASDPSTTGDHAPESTHGEATVADANTKDTDATAANTDAVVADPDAVGTDTQGADTEIADPKITDPLYADLDDESLLTALQTAHRAIATAHADQARAITELAHRRAKDAVTDLTGRKARGKQALGIGARAVSEEVSLELVLTKTCAATLVDTCVGLCTDVPDTLDALAAGDIDWRKATTIVDLVQTLVHAQEATNPDLDPEERIDPEALGKALEKELLKKALTETTAGLRRAAARMMIGVNAQAAEQRHKIKKTHRAFWLSPDEDSMARIGGYLPADAGIRVKHALTRLAYHLRHHSGPDDKRTLDQLRIDSLVDTLTTAADNLHPDTGTGAPPEPTNASAAGNPDAEADSPTTPDTGTTSDASAHGATDAGTDAAAGTGAGPTADPDADAETGARSGAEEGRIPDDDTTLDDELANWDHEPTDPDDEPTASQDEWTTTRGENTDRQDRPTKPGTTPETKPGTGTKTKAGLGPGRGRSGSDPRVTVTISASTLTGDDDHPGYLHGFGPIIASMARDIAATGSWRCAITDNVHGTLLGLGTSTYTPNYKPTQPLRRYLITRDRICRVPGCNTPAEISDQDHCTPWPDGATCECNMEGLCPGHHRMKHETGFTLSPSTNPDDPPGTLYWTTPAGHQYPSYPASLDPNPPGGPGAGAPRFNAPEPVAPQPFTPDQNRPGLVVPQPGPPGPDAPQPSTSGPGTSRSHTSDYDPSEKFSSETCSACTDADTEISAENDGVRALDQEQNQARENAAAREHHTANLDRRRHYTDPDYDPDYDDPYGSTTGGLNRPTATNPAIIRPFHHRETLGLRTSFSDTIPPASSQPSRLRCTEASLNPPPVTFDGPPPF